MRRAVGRASGYRVRGPIPARPRVMTQSESAAHIGGDDIAHSHTALAKGLHVHCWRPLQYGCSALSHCLCCTALYTRRDSLRKAGQDTWRVSAGRPGARAPGDRIWPTYVTRVVWATLSLCPLAHHTRQTLLLLLCRIQFTLYAYVLKAWESHAGWNNSSGDVTS